MGLSMGITILNMSGNRLGLGSDLVMPQSVPAGVYILRIDAGSTYDGCDHVGSFLTILTGFIDINYACRIRRL